MRQHCNRNEIVPLSCKYYTFKSKLVGNITNPETRHSMPRSGLSMLEQRLSPPFEESNPTWRGREYGENSDLKIQEIPSEMPNNFKIFLRTPLGNSRVETNLVPRVLSPLTAYEDTRISYTLLQLSSIDNECKCQILLLTL